MDDIEGRYEELFLCAFRSGRRVSLRVDDAAEVASEAVARAFVAWHRIEPYAAAWVSRVAVNLAIAQLRRDGRSAAAYPTVQDGPNSDRVVLAAELARLPRRQREVLVLRFIADLDEEETAKILRVTVGTVHTHATRGLARIRQRVVADDIVGAELL